MTEAPLFLLAMLGLCQDPDQESRGFTDPAPPQVHTRPAGAVPAAGENPRVRTHGTPRPLAANAQTQDWAAFLGPNRDGISSERLLRKDWPESGPPLVWEMEAGMGYTSPSILGERLVYFHRIKDEEVVECLHAETGQRYWKVGYPTEYEDSYGYGNGPRCSPLLEDGRVYAYGAQGDLLCLDLETGHIYWRRNLSAEFEVPQDFFGVVATPLLHGENLLVHVGAPDGPCVVALNKRTGALVWGSGRNWRAGYSSPVLGHVHGHERLFVFVGGKSRPPRGGLMMLDPGNGHIDFEFDWRSRTFESVNAACPVLVGDRVFISATYKTGGALLEVKEDLSYAVAWTSDVLGTHFNTAIHVDGHLYGFDGRNEPDASLVCQELATGKEVWRTVLEWEETLELESGVKSQTIGVHRGQLLRVDDAFLCLGERGHLAWLDLTPQGCKVLARHWLFAADETWTPPVVSRGLLYICQNARGFVGRTQPRLLCYDLRGGSS